MPKVPVQKGIIEANQMTSKMKPHAMKVAEAQSEAKQRRDGMTLKMHTPKK